MSLKPKSKKRIGGKTISEILKMPRSTRYRWRKTLLPKEREEAIKTLEIIRQAKISEAMTGDKNPMKRPKQRARQSVAMAGDKNPMRRPEVAAKRSGDKNPTKKPEVKTKISATVTELWKDPEFIDKHSGENNPMRRPEVAAKFRGDKNPNWQGGISFEPYCPMFNERQKRTTRNKYLNRCVICGKSTLQNKRHLVVHHIDLNKQQGCEGINWKLIPMCALCHGKIHRNRQNELMLNMLLIKNKGGEIGFAQNP